MKTIAIAILCCLLPLSSSAAELGGLLDQAKTATSGSVSSMLGQQFGVTESQAEGGIGSILALAQERLKAGDFDTVINSIPGGSGYMDTAKQLGVLDMPLENLNGLTGALGKLGMPAGTISDFLPAAVNALGGIGGPEVSQLLQSVVAPG